MREICFLSVSGHDTLPTPPPHTQSDTPFISDLPLSTPETGEVENSALTHECNLFGGRAVVRHHRTASVADGQVVA